MSEITEEQFKAIVSTAVHAALEALEAARKREQERIYELKQIAAECGVEERTVRRWIKNHGLPIEKDQLGLSILRCDLNAWLRKLRHRPYG